MSRMRRGKQGGRRGDGAGRGGPGTRGGGGRRGGGGGGGVAWRGAPPRPGRRGVRSGHNPSSAAQAVVAAPAAAVTIRVRATRTGRSAGMGTRVSLFYDGERKIAYYVSPIKLFRPHGLHSQGCIWINDSKRSRTGPPGHSAQTGSTFVRPRWMPAFAAISASPWAIGALLSWMRRRRRGRCIPT